MARTKKPADRHKQRTFSFRLPEPLMELLRRLARENRRTLSGELQVALEHHLAAHGLKLAEGDGTRPDGKNR